MTALFDTVVPQWRSQQRVELASWRPHAVVINLATNDYSDGHKAPVDETAFVIAYKGAIRRPVTDPIVMRSGASTAELPEISCVFVIAYQTWRSVDAGMVKELRLAFGQGVKIVLCLGSMLNDTWPTEETKSLSRCVISPNTTGTASETGLLLCTLQQLYACTECIASNSDAYSRAAVQGKASNTSSH